LPNACRAARLPFPNHFIFNLHPGGKRAVLKWVAVVIILILAFVGAIALMGARLPEEHTVSRTVELSQSPQQVWDVIAGPPTWRPEVARFEVLTEGVHRKWIEYGRHGEKMTYEVVESDPPQKLVTRIADPRLPFGGSWTYVITPAATGSSLTITEQGEIHSAVFRFVARYVQGYTATIDKYLNALRAKLSTS
jgi:uncharacterized protein YndB with AHSA1/START domain